MKFARFLIFMLIISALPISLWAQTAATAKISGLVTTPNGEATPGAIVKLTDQATKTEKTTTTNEEGFYVFANIEPTIYDLTVSAQGFKATVITNVKVDVSASAVRDVRLELGDIKEVVTVTATGEIALQKDDSSVGVTLSAEQLRRLPAANRVATELLVLQPAVSPNGQVAGARADQNVFNLDGLDVSDNVGVRGAAGTVVPIPAESVQEFRVQVSNANATFGRAAGGQGTLITKRGTNAFHGSLYAYHQNDNLNANSWSNNRLGLKKPESKNNLFGGTLGGPIWKDRTFFFFNYEGQRFPGSTQITRLVPTASLLSGTLRFRDATGAIVSYNLNPANGPISSGCGSNGATPCDPRALGASSSILTYMRLLPAPNNSTVGDGLNTSGFTTNLPTNTRGDYGALRLDQQFGSKWSLDVKGAFFRGIADNAGQADLLNLKAGANIAQQPKNLLVALTGALRPNLTNDFRVGRTYDSQVLGVIDPTTRGFNLPINLGGGALDEPVDVDTQRARRQTIISGTTEFSDNATWAKGTHTFQFGANLRRISTFFSHNDRIVNSLTTPVANIGFSGNVVIPASQRPPTCSASVTANCLRSADSAQYDQLYSSLLGMVDNVTFIAARDGDLNNLPPGTFLINDSANRYYEFHFADTWRLKPSLTLNYGLQYQWSTAPVEKLGRQTLLVFKDTLKPVDALDYMRQKQQAAENGDIFNPDLAYVPEKELGGGVYNVDRNLLGPRASLAWQPSYESGLLGRLFGEQKTVLRGGYAIVYDRFNTVTSVVFSTFAAGFGQTVTLAAPRNGAGQPFRAGVDGELPLPTVPTVTSPITPAKAVGPSLGFGELFTLGIDPNIRTPRNHQFDFTIQRELPHKMFLEVGYIGRLGRNLYQNTNLNSPAFFFKDKASGQLFAEAFDALAAQLRSGVAANAVTPQPWFENQLPAFSGGATRILATNFGSQFVLGNLPVIFNAVLDGLAPQSFNNRQVGDQFLKTSNGRSNYHALFASLRQRLSSGLQFDFNYTLSKSLDQLSLIQNGLGLFTTSYFPDVDYAPSDFDRRHVINANAIYDLPFGRGRRFLNAGKVLDRVIGGWYVSGIFTASSGLPLTFSQGVAAYGGGISLPLATGVIPTTSTDFGNSLHSGVVGSGGIGVNGDPARNGSGLNLFANPEEVFKSFRRVLLAQDGRHGRNVLRGFPRWNLDFSLGKETRITEGMKFTVGANFFNIFNHVNFNNPTLNINSPATFGVITGAFGQRTIQVSGRFDF